MANPIAIELIKEYEKFKPEPYYATKDEEKRGILTIGYGQTEGVKKDSKVSEEDALNYLTKQVDKTEAKLAKELKDKWSVLSEPQKAAVLSLAYNTDKDVVGQFKKSKAFKALKEGDFDKFKVEAFDPELGFVKQSGKVLDGLVKRRQEERMLFDLGSEMMPTQEAQLDMALSDSSIPTIQNYTVEPGDTLFSISRKLGIGIADLIDMNNINNPDMIQPGLTLNY